MNAKNTQLYSSVRAYLNGPEGMPNEVLMWYTAAGLFLRGLILKTCGYKFGGLLENMGLRVRKRIQPVSVLDVCCGPGTFANYLSLVANIQVTGVDLNPDFIAYASRRFSGCDWKFIRGDVLKLSLDKKFDFVLASSAYHHIEDKKKVDFLRVLVNHLDERGKIIMCENFLPPYADEKSREDSVEKYYSDLKEHYRRKGVTQIAMDSIREVHSLEKAGVEEHKVDFPRFLSHLEQVCLTVSEDIPVWQPSGLRKDNAGSHVLVLEKEVEKL